MVPAVQLQYLYNNNNFEFAWVSWTLYYNDILYVFSYRWVLLSDSKYKRCNYIYIDMITYIQYQYEHMLAVRSSFPFRIQQLIMIYLISIYNSTNKVNCRCQREANGALLKTFSQHAKSWSQNHETVLDFKVKLCS